MYIKTAYTFDRKILLDFVNLRFGVVIRLSWMDWRFFKVKRPMMTLETQLQSQRLTSISGACFKLIYGVNQSRHRFSGIPQSFL